MVDVSVTAAQLWDIHEEYLVVRRQTSTPSFKYTPGWYSTVRETRKKARRVFKDMIHAWAKEKGIEVNVRSELDLNEPSGWSLPINIHLVSIYNGKGQIGKKSRWLNKISVDAQRYRENKMNVRLVSHVAKTDPDFLSPLGEEFYEFITEFVKALYPDKGITTKWGR